MYIGHARLCLSESVCLSVLRRMPTLLHGPGRSFDEWQGSPLVVHYWVDLQSVHGFRRYDNIALNVKSASACTPSMPGCINGCGRGGGEGQSGLHMYPVVLCRGGVSDSIHSKNSGDTYCKSLKKLHVNVGMYTMYLLVRYWNAY